MSLKYMVQKNDRFEEVTLLPPKIYKPKWPTISDDPNIQAAYERMRREGTSHNMAEICATRTPPGSSNTDRAFMEGDWNGKPLDKECPEYRNFVLAEAKAAGVSTTGKVYKKQLAERIGDPKAWVSDLSDVKRVCEERGMTLRDPATDRVIVKGPQYVPEPNRPRVAEDIVMQHVANEIGKAPHKIKKVGDVRQIREEVIDRIGPKK